MRFAVAFYEWLGYNINSKQKEEILLPNIKPVSDLRNYNDVLRDVMAKEPVFLTKNGRGRYALMDMQDYERLQATITLLSELAKGEKSGQEQGWLTIDEVEESLGIQYE